MGATRLLERIQYMEKVMGDSAVKHSQESRSKQTSRLNS